MLCFYVLLQILSTTITILAEISPVIPVALFAGFSLVSLTHSIPVPYFHKSTFVFQNRSKHSLQFPQTSGLLSLFLPETHGAPLPDTPEQSEEVTWCHDEAIDKYHCICYIDDIYDCSNVCDFFWKEFTTDRYVWLDPPPQVPLVKGRKLLQFKIK